MDNFSEVNRDELKTAFYANRFIDEEREKCLIREIDKTPKIRWTQLSNRRLQNWGGVPHPKVDHNFYF